MTPSRNDSAASPPLFSIIVPVFNTAAYVGACLESALAQTEAAFEILVVDDGSTDASAAICADIAERDTRIRLFHKNNEGQGVARNVALSYATGRYVLFLDSDDTIDERTCEILRDRFADTDAEVISFGLRFQTHDGHEIASRHVDHDRTSEAPGIFIDAMLDRDFLTSPCNKAYRRALLVDHSIEFPPLRAYEDALFSRHVAYCATKVLYIPDILYRATTRAGSTTRSMSARNFAIAGDLIARERMLFADRLTQDRDKAAFGAHVVRFLAHLLLLAAFRVDDRDERRECWRLAAAAGFDTHARRRDVMALLSRRTRAQVAIARRPALARLAARVAKRLNITPY